MMEYGNNGMLEQFLLLIVSVRYSVGGSAALGSEYRYSYLVEARLDGTNKIVCRTLWR